MKCPKCGYLGFETSERCRNCGYDFSLAINVGPASELPLHQAEGAGEPLADFPLGDADQTPPGESAAGLDLDRVIGEPAPSLSRRPGRAHAADRTAIQTPTPALPFHDNDDTPLITAPRPVRPPLSVRRTTPEIPRTRSRVVTPRPDEGDFGFQIETSTAEELPSESEIVTTTRVATKPDPVAASAVARLGAALIDLVLLAAIDVAVLYLTVALVGLSVDQIRLLPVGPVVTFFAILNGGYLVTFTAARGQTIGKMVTGVRVMGIDGSRVDIGAAVVRAAGCGVSLLTAGLGYLPAFMTADGRALQDRISGTRVVSAR